MLEKLTRADFAQRIGEPFRLAPGSQRIDLMLVQADAAGHDASAAGGRQPFSLVFRGPSEPVLPQAIYFLEHREMGSLGLFLVPIGPDSEGMLYEAVFT